MKMSRVILTAAIAACFSVATFADGIDPKGVIKDPNLPATPITKADPNPTFSENAEPNNPNCLSSAPCVFAVFQNRLGTTLKSIDIFIPTDGLTFSCGNQAGQGNFFDLCHASSVTGGTNLFFSTDGAPGFGGVQSGKCVPDFDDLFGLLGCDEDDWKGGIFGVDIEGTDLPPGTNISGSVITTPEPDSGLVLLFGTLVCIGFVGIRKGVFSLVQ